MRLGWIKGLVLPLGLLTLLAACQTGPNPRYYAQPSGYSPAYDPCQLSSYGCGQRTRSFLSGRVCPPGYRLVRMSYRLHGGSVRDCVPVAPRQVYRYAGGPPCGIGYDRGCNRVYDARSYRARADRGLRYRSAPPIYRRSACCY